MEDNLFKDHIPYYHAWVVWHHYGESITAWLSILLMMHFSGSTIASRPGACTHCHMHLIETEPSRFYNSLRIVTLCHWNYTFWCRITIKIDYSGQCITRFIAIGFFIATTTLNFTTTQLTRLKRRTSSIYMVLSKLHIIILHITIIWLSTAVCHNIFW